MEKNNTLNLMKFVACVMVIFIHIKFPGSVGVYVTALARFAVPFFFMISGYYSFELLNTKAYVKKHIKKIFKLIVIVILAYFVYSVLYNYIYGDKSFLESLLNFDSFKYFVMLNEVSFAVHIWFLCALLYVYIVYYFGFLDLYICSIILTVSIFILCIKNPNVVKKNNVFARFGEKYSLGIYISHVMILLIFKNIIIPDAALQNTLFQWFFPIMVLAISFVVVVLYYKIKQKIIKYL